MTRTATTASLSASALWVALVLDVLFASIGCAGSIDATSSLVADASFEASYGGGGSVIPTFTADGGSGTGTYPYGPDGTSLAPCPRDAAKTVPDSAHAADAGIADVTVDAACPGPLASGDLVIDELMIASQSGGGDHGEWLEVMSTRDCAIDLKGLYAAVPHGKGTTLASIATDMTLPPHGFFLIADSSDAFTNHSLPGIVVTWGTGTSSDVLLNSGDSITLYTASATIDLLTYPNPTKMVDGASMAFPSDCDPSLRTAFGNWQPSVASWTPGYYGTPSGPNTDISCPVAPPGAPAPPTSPCDG
jgi:hypothetical protein